MKIKSKQVEFGDSMCDTMTGFVGKVTARHEYANGCVRYMLEAPNHDDGGIHELIFDEDRLKHVDDAPAQKRGKTGGARPTPPRATAR